MPRIPSRQPLPPKTPALAPVSTFAECVILRSHLPSGVNIDLDLRAIAANRNPDRARSDSHFPILEPKADVAGGGRGDLPVAGIQLPLVESGDGGEASLDTKTTWHALLPPPTSILCPPNLAPGYMGKFRGRQVEVKRSMVISVCVFLTATWSVPKGAALLVQRLQAYESARCSRTNASTSSLLPLTANLPSGRTDARSRMSAYVGAETTT